MNNFKGMKLKKKHKKRTPCAYLAYCCFLGMKQACIKRFNTWSIFGLKKN